MPINPGDFVRLHIPRTSELHPYSNAEALVHHLEGRGRARKAAVMLLDGRKPVPLLVPLRWVVFEKRWGALR